MMDIYKNYEVKFKTELSSTVPTDHRNFLHANFVRKIHPKSASEYI